MDNGYIDSWGLFAHLEALQDRLTLSPPGSIPYLLCINHEFPLEDEDERLVKEHVHVNGELRY